MAASGMQWVPPLPPGWEARWDPNQRAFFFIDHQNKVTSWEDPRWSKQKLATPMAGGQKSHQGEGIPMRDMSSRASPKASHTSGHQSHTSRHSTPPRHETTFSNQREANLEAIVANVQSKFPGTTIQVSLIKDILASCNNDVDVTVAQLVDLGFTQKSATPKRNSHASHGSTDHQHRPRSSSGHSPASKSPHRGGNASGTATPQRASPARQQISDAEKLTRKNRMRAEFKDLEDEVVKMALEACQYNEEKARATLNRVTSKWQTISSSDTSRPGTSASERSTDQRPLSPASLPQPATMEPVAFSITAEERLETNDNSRPSRGKKKTSTGTSGTGGQRSHTSGQQSQHHRAKQVTKMSEQLLTTTNDLLNHLATTSPCCPEEQRSPRVTPQPSPSHSPTPERPKHVVTKQPQPKSKATTQQPQPRPHHTTRQRSPNPSGPVGGAGLAQGHDPALLVGSSRYLCTGPDHSLFSGSSVGADGPNPEYHAGRNSELHQGHNSEYHQGTSNLASGTCGALGPNPALRCSAEHNAHLPLDAGRQFLQTSI